MSEVVGGHVALFSKCEVLTAVNVKTAVIWMCRHVVWLIVTRISEKSWFTFLFLLVSEEPAVSSALKMDIPLKHCNVYCYLEQLNTSPVISPLMIFVHSCFTICHCTVLIFCFPHSSNLRFTILSMPVWFFYTHICTPMLVSPNLG